jgi:hypothetical protein
LIGRRRIAKGRPIALPAIAIQCELRYYQNFFPYFLHGKIHLAILVLKNSQIFDLLRKLIDVSLAIGFTNSQKNTEPRADSADRFAGNPNLGSGNSLDNGSHGELVLEMVGFFSLRINWILQGYGAAKRETAWPFIGFIYLVTKKITVDNAAEGH